MNQPFPVYLAIGLVVSCGIAAFALVKYIALRRRGDSRFINEKTRYEDKLADRNRDIKRLEYIVADYQARLTGKNAGSNTGQSGRQPITGAASDLVQEKHAMEAEKQQFAEKTRKLWEQSLAIHKEKERIDEMRKAVELHFKHVTDSIHYAQHIQHALLPPTEFINSILANYFILYKPRDIVSGDFYWVHCWDEYLYLVAADCTGHGVPGAFMSMLGISFLNDIVNRQEEPDAAEILDRMRTRIIYSLKQDGTPKSSRDGMDMALCIINTSKRTIQYAGANNSMLHFHQGVLDEYKATKAPVAYYSELYPFTNHDIPYVPGDFLYMYSDGFADQFGGNDGRKFQLKTFRTLLTKLSSEEKDMPVIKNRLEETFQEWKGERYRQIDDVLVFGVELY